MSQRNDDDPVLDAARACVLAVGVRRTTVTDVARRAGVSRMTLYRRFPDLEGVLSALMTREFGRLVADAAAGGRDGGPRLARAGRGSAVRAAARRRPRAAAPLRHATARRDAEDGRG